MDDYSALGYHMVLFLRFIFSKYLVLNCCCAYYPQARRKACVWMFFLSFSSVMISLIYLEYCVIPR